MTQAKENDYIKLADKVLMDSEDFITKYSDEVNGLLLDKSSFYDITKIIQEGLAIYNHIVEKNLYADDAYMQELLGKISREASKLTISEENAKKLNFRDALVDWGKLHALIISMCVVVLSSNNQEKTEE